MHKKNEIYTAEITDYTTEGSGVCKIDGIAVFVPSSAAGDIAEVKILKTAKSYAYGKIEKLIKPSESRVCPDCEVYQKCGGCSFRHISYSSELAFKQKRVYDALTRIGGVNGKLIEGIIGSDRSDNYRNKAQLPVTRDKDGHIRVGFFAPRSHRIIPNEVCRLQSEIFSDAVGIFTEWAEKYGISPYDESSHTGVLRHLYLRHAEKTGQLMVCPVINAKGVKREKELVEMLRAGIPGLATVVINVNTEKTNVITGSECRTIYGSGYITDELCGLRFRISPLSFYQVNRAQAEKLYTIAAGLADLSPNETLIDMYCGTGTIGLTMANRVKTLIGAEIVPQAIEDAKKNAAENNITNAEFICADASAAASALAQRGIRPDCVILDPPRKGCDGSLIDTVSSMSPKRIVYVSCDPATLARDVRLFSGYGYQLQRAIPVDMFPRTTHVETVVLLRRKNIEDSEIFQPNETTSETVVLLRRKNNDDHLEFTWTAEEFGTKGCRATYPDIQAYIQDKYGFKVSHLNIAQIKRKCGIIERENYNQPKSEKSKQPGCTKEREDAIMDAFRHFKLI